jgi:hypothetical protein
MITMERRGRRIMRGHQIIERLPSYFYLTIFLDLVLRVYSTMEHSVWFHRLPFYFFVFSEQTIFYIFSYSVTVHFFFSTIESFSRLTDLYQTRGLIY